MGPSGRAGDAIPAALPWLFAMPNSNVTKAREPLRLRDIVMDTRGGPPRYLSIWMSHRLPKNYTQRGKKDGATDNAVRCTVRKPWSFA